MERTEAACMNALNLDHPETWPACGNVVAVGTADDGVLRRMAAPHASVFHLRGDNLLETDKDGNAADRGSAHLRALAGGDTLAYIAHSRHLYLCEQLRALGVTAAIDGDLPENPLWKAHFDASPIRENWERIREAGALFADGESKETYWGRLLYRLTHNPLCSRTIADRPEYFHPLCSPRRGDVIVDGGAYDGSVLNAFREALRDKCVIHAFEPDRKNYFKLRNREAGNVFAHNLGLYDAKTTLSFVPAGNMSSHLSDAMPEDADAANRAETSINVIDIDTFSAENGVVPNFIKLDVEGAEQAVLRGAAKTLRAHRPRLAISAYHRFDDLWEIPLLIRELNPEYTLYLAHYGGHPFFSLAVYAA